MYLNLCFSRLAVIVIDCEPDQTVNFQVSVALKPQCLMTELATGFNDNYASLNKCYYLMLPVAIQKVNINAKNY